MRRSKKSSLRSRTADLVLHKILQGGVAEGRLNESELALKLGVSRTPLREALLSLQQIGIVQQATRGFVLPGISRRLVREHYPLIATLEALAVRSQTASSIDIRRLRESNSRFASQAESSHALALDNEFHDLLISGCQNQLLVRIAHGLKYQVSRIESLYMRNLDHVAPSAEQHGEIVDALARGDTGLAAFRVEDHWLAGMHRVLEQFDWQ